MEPTTLYRNLVHSSKSGDGCAASKPPPSVAFGTSFAEGDSARTIRVYQPVDIAGEADKLPDSSPAANLAAGDFVFGGLRKSLRIQQSPIDLKD
jgi:hypothetical protein